MKSLNATRECSPVNQPRRRRWQGAQLMPGAGRLLFHLHHAGVPVALATSTPRATMERKLAAPAAQGLRCIFQATPPPPPPPPGGLACGHGASLES